MRRRSYITTWAVVYVETQEKLNLTVKYLIELQPLIKPIKTVHFLEYGELDNYGLTKLIVSVS